MQTIFRLVLSILALPIILIVEVAKSERGVGRKILYVLIVLIVFASTWLRGYKNLVDATEFSLYEIGAIDKKVDILVRGRSMLPTIEDGDYVTLHNPGKYGIERGDIISFKNIETGNQYYIKRVIGLAGERISIAQGQVRIDGQALHEPYIYRNAPTYGNTFLLECKSFVIPKGKLAVFGDNRIASTDSRVFGFVDIKDIDGVIKTGVVPDFATASGIENTPAPQLDANTFLNRLNERRREEDLAPLLEQDVLSSVATQKAEDVAQRIDTWKQDSLDVPQVLDEAGYDYFLLQEIVTMGNYDAEQLSEHILELYPYNQDVLSGQYYEIGIGVSQVYLEECATPVFVILLSWPTTPNITQEEIEIWQTDIDNLTQLITTLKTLKTNPEIDQNENRNLIDELSSLLEQAVRLKAIFLENRWPTEAESQLLEEYRQNTQALQKKLSDFIIKYEQVIQDETIRSYLSRYRWGNPEFNQESNKTRLLFSQGKYQEQLESAKKLISLASNDEEEAIGYYWEGLAYYNLDLPDKAERSLLQAVNLNKNYAAPYVTLSAISFSREDAQQGFEYAKKCVELDPNYAWCHNNLGLAYAFLGQKEAAVRELEKAVSLDPNSYVFNDNLKRVKEDL